MRCIYVGGTRRCSKESQCLDLCVCPALSNCAFGCQCVRLRLYATVGCHGSVAAATENRHSNSTSSRRPQPLSREQSLTQSNLLSRVCVFVCVHCICVSVGVPVCILSCVFIMCVCVCVFLCGCVQVKERRPRSSTSGKGKGGRRASET